MEQKGRKFVVGLLGGSFNPVHIGHMMLASYLAQWGYVDRIWMLLSPCNPLKGSNGLLPDIRRLDMLNIAAKGASLIDICDIELTMPRPSYTINTLDMLRERHPEFCFKLVIGSDNWNIFDRWRDWRRILDEYGVIVYPRPGYSVEMSHVDGLEVVDAPMVNVSSTFVRDSIASGRDMNYFLPAGVYKYICDNNLYKK